MIEIYNYFLKPGQMLAVQMIENQSRKHYYFRILGVEETPYPYSFGAISAGSSSGWKRPQDAQTRYFLEAAEESVAIHHFTGVSPTRAEIYLQYPLDKDRNSLVGSRTVGSGIGIFAEGKNSPYRDPSPRTELLSLKDIGPAFNAYTPVAATVRVFFWAVCYRITPPITAVMDRISKPEEQMLDEERRRARVLPIFGKTPTEAPSWLQGKGL